jgi:hypothetical protein
MVRIGAISGASSFRIFGRMLSGPAALLEFNFCNSLSTPVHVNVDFCSSLIASSQYHIVLAMQKILHHSYFV